MLLVPDLDFDRGIGDLAEKEGGPMQMLSRGRRTTVADLLCFLRNELMDVSSRKEAQIGKDRALGEANNSELEMDLDRVSGACVLFQECANSKEDIALSDILQDFLDCARDILIGEDWKCGLPSEEAIVAALS